MAATLVLGLGGATAAAFDAHDETTTVVVKCRLEEDMEGQTALHLAGTWGLDAKPGLTTPLDPKPPGKTR